jgi:hypothetical protein
MYVYIQHKFSQPSRHPAAGTQFNISTGTKLHTKVQIPTPEALQASRAGHSQCTQFTCFPGTKVQMLTLRACRRKGPAIRSACGALFDTGTKFTCFTGTKIQILTRCLVCHSLLLGRWNSRRQLYLLYWYKSTNTDAVLGFGTVCCQDVGIPG